MNITIYHTNDLHSDYERLKAVHTYLKNNRQKDDLYLDSGDFLDLKDIIVQADMGGSAIDLMLSCGIDAMSVGNNEIDLGKDYLREVASKVTMLSCNLTDTEYKSVPNILDSIILEKAGKKILIIGISPYYSKTIEDNNFNGFFHLYNLLVHPSIEKIKKIMECQKGRFDYCILLSHNGISVEEYIMKEIPQINLCLGGHSHTVANYKGYSSSGKGEYIGKIVLEINDKGINEISSEQIELSNSEDTEFDKLLHEKTIYADKILDRDIGSLENLNFDAFKENNLVNFVCDCLYDRFEGDFAIMHNGIAEGSLLQPVSVKSLIQTFPSKLNPTTYKISGEKILTAVKKSFNIEHIQQSGVGAGFRGHVLGTLSYSHNVKICTNPFSMKINGTELDRKKEYLIITDDYIQRGTGYPSMAVADSKASWDVWFIRDLVKHYIHNRKIYEECKIKRVD